MMLSFQLNALKLVECFVASPSNVRATLDISSVPQTLIPLFLRRPESSAVIQYAFKVLSRYAGCSMNWIPASAG